MISGRTAIIAHLGFPTESFTAPMIYNPWFVHRGIDAVVVPMAVRAEDYAGFLKPLQQDADIGIHRLCFAQIIRHVLAHLGNIRQK